MATLLLEAIEGSVEREGEDKSLEGMREREKVGVRAEARLCFTSSSSSS